MTKGENPAVLTSDILTAFGVNPAYIVAAAEHNITISAGAKGLRLYKNGEQCGTLKLSLTAIDHALKGSLGSWTKGYIASELQDLLNKALSAKVVLKKEAPEAKIHAEVIHAEVKAAQSKTPPLSTDTTTEGSMVAALSEAKDLYAPVRGTSAGSVYHVVAIRPDLKIAVRFGPKVSIRAEGDIPMYQNRLVVCGFEIKSPQYASQHFDYGGDPDVARRAIGAMIMGLGLEMTTQIPDLERIRGKGK